MGIWDLMVTMGFDGSFFGMEREYDGNMMGFDGDSMRI
jgi:hypothetical protein